MWYNCPKSFPRSVFVPVLICIVSQIKWEKSKRIVFTESLYPRLVWSVLSAVHRCAFACCSKHCLAHAPFVRYLPVHLKPKLTCGICWSSQRIAFIELKCLWRLSFSFESRDGESIDHDARVQTVESDLIHHERNLHFQRKRWTESSLAKYIILYESVFSFRCLCNCIAKSKLFWKINK